MSDLYERGALHPETVSPERYLSREDLGRLANYKWRYSLESHGFTAAEAGRLLFAKHLVATERLGR